MIGSSLVPVKSTLASAARFGLVSSTSVQNSFGKYCFPPFKANSPLARKLAILSALTVSSIMPVILGKHPQGVGLDAQIDVVANQYRLSFGLRFLDAEGQGKNAVIPRISAETRVDVFGGSRFLKNDAQLPAVR